MAATLAAIITLCSCGGGTKNVEIAMSDVQPGTFSLNTLKDKRLVTGASSARQMLMGGYSISSQPISEGLWAEVMGGKAENPDAPKTGISYNDCEKFVGKLSKATGKDYVIPSEAMWEYAYDNGAIQPLIGSKEWTSTAAQGTEDAKITRAAKEKEETATFTKGAILLRVAIAGDEPCPQMEADAMEGKNSAREHVCGNETIKVNGVNFNMVAVKGGTAAIGATSEQGKYAEDDEKPIQVVVVEDFEIGRTEVTVAQWLAVMDNLPLGNYAEDGNKPVINVSWFAAQEYIMKLNKLSGRTFRLPTEEEWEYAARGGVKSGHFRYAGSNKIDQVAVNAMDNEQMKVKNVASLKPNELGIYDMSGNAWEWCENVYGLYGQPVPEENDRVTAESPVETNVYSVRVMRGGSAASYWKGCRVSNRSGIPADNVKGTFGFRLAI